MSEENTMTEESKKTIIAFIVGLVVGGLLVYIFAMPAEHEHATDTNRDAAVKVTDSDAKDAVTDEDDAAASTSDRGNAAKPVSAEAGSIGVKDQAAGSSIALDSVVYPADRGWIGVRDYEDGRLAGLLGVVRFDKAEGLMPKSVALLRPTVAGRTYAVVFYSDNGDKVFNLAGDAQIEGELATFSVR